MRFSFVRKAAITIVLVGLFDRLFPYGFSGAVIGGFAGAWLVGVVLGRADVRRDRRAWCALALAGVFAVALIDDPGPLSWALFWCALSVAALMPRTGRFDDAWHWAARLGLHAVSGIVTPIADVSRSLRARHGVRHSPGAVAAILALPLIGGGLFIALFAAANPVIAQVLAAIQLPSIVQMLVWALVATCLWPSLRPHALVTRLAARLPNPEPILPGTSLPSVLIALALFNGIFAVQNALDIVVLWSGGPLPTGMTQTEYVHRGAYPLIVTALIAGVMALAMLRPGSASERHPWARRMVTLWVVQNLILVASSAWRTIDYIDTEMMTGLRLAALIWMALVALGLALIGWRILAGRSARWLINRNALAAFVVLAVCSFIDLGAIAAAWNVRHQSPHRVDLCYLAGLGDAALLPLIDLEHRTMDAATPDRIRHVRAQTYTDLSARQESWTHWTARGARRLVTANAMLGPDPARPSALPDGAWWNCDGSVGGASTPAPRP